VSGERVRLVVGPERAGLRIDQFLAAATALSRRAARELLATGEVTRNGAVLRVQKREVQVGDVVELPSTAVSGRGQTPPLPPEQLAALHDDGWLLAVDKPAGVLSQPAEERAPGELAMDERVLTRRAWELGSPPFLRLVHRLDRVTSGVLLFAAREEALAPLARAWRAGEVERRYLALVDGEPADDARTIVAPIARAPAQRWQFEVDARGEAATTRVRVLARGSGGALVACELVTGRTHQVRVHLAHVGHPVRGDRLYGSRTDAPRPLLHAASLRLPHPRDGAPVAIGAPVPADLAAAAEALGIGLDPDGLDSATMAP